MKRLRNDTPNDARESARRENESEREREREREERERKKERKKERKVIGKIVRRSVEKVKNRGSKTTIAKKSSIGRSFSRSSHRFRFFIKHTYNARTT